MDDNEIITQKELKAKWEAVNGPSDVAVDNECIKAADVEYRQNDGITLAADDDPDYLTDDNELVKSSTIVINKVQHNTTFCIQYNGGGYHMTPRVKSIVIQPELGTTLYPSLIISDEGFASSIMEVNSNEGINMLTLNLRRIYWDNPSNIPFTIDIQLCNAGYGWDNPDMPYAEFGYMSYPNYGGGDLYVSVPLFEGEDNTIYIRIVTE